MKKTITWLTVLLMSTHTLCCQNDNTDNTQILKEKQAALQAKLKATYPFLKLSLDSIAGSEIVAPFFEKMYCLAQNNVGIINIVHFGDSHIQADMMTEKTRILLQESFGNAGRGLIFPHRIARSNEPNNIRSSASGEWQQVSIIGKNRESEPGLATRSIFTADSSASFDIQIKDGELFYPFKKLTVFSPKAENYFDFSINNNLGEEFLSAQSTDNVFTFSVLSNSFSLKITPTAATQKEFRLNGIVLQNDAKSGILYHSMGANGAHFTEYNRSPEFFTQLPCLQPDLIIISLGTNEGAARDITKQEVYENARQMIENIRATNPETPILLTTPVHNYYQKKYLNQRMKLVHEALLEVANDTKSAIIDLYAVGGGYGSCQLWKAEGLLRPDGVHFSAEGYRLQGDLIFNAIINSYLKYVANH